MSIHVAGVEAVAGCVEEWAGDRAGIRDTGVPISNEVGCDAAFEVLSKEARSVEASAVSVHQQVRHERGGRGVASVAGQGDVEHAVLELRPRIHPRLGADLIRSGDLSLREVRHSHDVLREGAVREGRGRLTACIGEQRVCVGDSPRVGELPMQRRRRRVDRQLGAVPQGEVVARVAVGIAQKSTRLSAGRWDVHSDHGALHHHQRTRAGARP